MAVRTKPDPPLDVDLPITPMLDLAFQVLLFFILTYHPSQFEGQMDLALPDIGQAKAASPKDAKPEQAGPGELELPSEITVFVKTEHGGSNDGDITQISVQERQGTKEIPSQKEGTKPIPDLKALRSYLEKARGELSNQDDIKIQADSMLKYKFVMEVMDVCTQAGFRSVGFGPPPDLAAAGQ
jgi:biopolymer transport protein ExbD